MLIVSKHVPELKLPLMPLDEYHLRILEVALSQILYQLCIYVYDVIFIKSYIIVDQSS